MPSYVVGALMSARPTHTFPLSGNQISASGTIEFVKKLKYSNDTATKATCLVKTRHDYSGKAFLRG